MADTDTKVRLPQVGDILYSSWGYDQTNVDFYEVVRATDKSVWVYKVAKDFVEGSGNGGPVDYVVPVPGMYLNDYGWEPVPDENGTASVWDGKAGKYLTVLSYPEWTGWGWEETPVRLRVPKPPKRHKVRQSVDGYDIHLTSYSSAWLWDGTAKYQTGYGWGH